jgi:hypothetical protein
MLQEPEHQRGGNHQHAEWYRTVRFESLSNGWSMDTRETIAMWASFSTIATGLSVLVKQWSHNSGKFIPVV